MEIGNEISQKIRSAIKAKLVDLGAYVDDELPDYIMVMVANKKSQAQMTADLNLFLGDNTEVFTSWLHGLLTKLKSIAADPASEEAAAPAGTDSQKKSADAGDEGKKDTASEQNEDALTLQPEKDEFEEETETEKQKSGKSRLSAAAAKSASSSSGSRLRRSSAGKSEAKPTDKSAKYEPDGSSRKRKMPGSVVSTVTVASVEEEIKEEGYDPTKPMIGRVASTVKVGPRRSSIPVGRQASSNLVMKAVKEAEVSIEKSEKQKQVVRPLQHRLGDRDTDMRPAGRGRGRSVARNARDEPRMRSVGMPSARRLPHTTRVKAEPRSPEDGREVSLELMSSTRREEEARRQQVSDEEYEPEDPLAARRLKQEDSDVEDERRIMELSLPEESSQIVYHPTPIHDAHRSVSHQVAEDEPVVEHRTISVKPRQHSVDTRNVDVDTLYEDEEEVLDYSYEDQRRVESTPIPRSERPASPKFVVTLEGVEPEMMEMDISDVREDEAGRNIVRVKPTVQEPQDMDEDEYMMMDEDFPSPPKMGRFPGRCRFWPACMKGDACPYTHPSTPCMKFPRCSFGDKCAYIHPKCKFDGRCTRADCHFMHTAKNGPGGLGGAGGMPVMIQPVGVLPMQQSPHDGAASVFFEQSLSPPSLPPASKPPTGPPGKTKCRYFPHCTNVDCKFMHPKPCRFGSACRNQTTCTFSHPQLPSKDQLKWTASKQPSASINASLPP